MKSTIFLKIFCTTVLLSISKIVEARSSTGQRHASTTNGALKGRLLLVNETDQPHSAYCSECNPFKEGKSSL